MDALQAAKQVMKWKEAWRDKANDEGDQEMHDEYVEKEDLCRADAITYAAIAQAEQLERMADAAEQRNVLLKEFNVAQEESAKRHTESIAQSVTKFADAIYGPPEPDQSFVEYQNFKCQQTYSAGDE